MDFFCEFVKKFETFCASYSVAAGNNYGSPLEVVLGALYMTFQYFYYIVAFGHKIFNVFVNYVAFVIVVQLLRFHHAATNGSHLGTVVGVNDCGNDVSAESGTYLVKEVLVGLSVFLVLIVAYFQSRAVGRKTALAA